MVVELCDAGSAGVSLAETTEEGSQFRWIALSGKWARFRGGTMPIDASPCGMVIERNAALLFSNPERHFPEANVDPLVCEVLLVPFVLDGKPAGTVWVATHDPTRHFDQEDVRLLLSLSRMAAAMVQTTRTLDALKKSEDRLKVLVGELQHRTRNIFGLIGAIARQAIRSSTDLEDFRPRFLNRLDALARSQTLLTKITEGQTVTFNDLLTTELNGLGAFDSGKERVRLSGPSDVALPPKTIEALALALHELGTNALKYGALGQPSGTLDIAWRLDGEEGVLHVEWKESGVDLADRADPERRNGGGRRLIERVLPLQLKARTDFDLESDGVRVVLTVPVT